MGSPGVTRGDWCPTYPSRRLQPGEDAAITSATRECIIGRCLAISRRITMRLTQLLSILAVVAVLNSVLAPAVLAVPLDQQRGQSAGPQRDPTGAGGVAV